MTDVKKYGAYIAMLLAGLLLGYVFFSESNTKASHKHENAASQFYTCAMH